MLNNNLKNVTGAYLSPKTSEQLEKLQKQKTIFMLLSTLMFATSIFIPADISSLTTLSMVFFVNIYIAVIVLSVVVSIYGKNKHKIRSSVPKADSPRAGYNRFTYVSYELFTASHIVSAVGQIALMTMAYSLMTLISAILMVVSLIFCLVARFIFVYANNDLEFVATSIDTQSVS